LYRYTSFNLTKDTSLFTAHCTLHLQAKSIRQHNYDFPIKLHLPTKRSRTRWRLSSMERAAAAAATAAALE
jgi:hypothetical protein